MLYPARVLVRLHNRFRIGSIGLAEERRNTDPIALGSRRTRFSFLREKDRFGNGEDSLRRFSGVGDGQWRQTSREK